MEEPALQKAREWLANPSLVAEIVAENYDIARRYFSYTVLLKHLEVLVNDCLGA